MVAGGSAAGRLANKVARGWRVQLFENFKIIKGSERHKFGNSYVKEMMIQVLDGHWTVVPSSAKERLVLQSHVKIH